MSKRTLIVLALIVLLSLPVFAYAVMPHTSHDVTTVAARGKTVKTVPFTIRPSQPVLNPAECPDPGAPGCGGG